MTDKGLKCGTFGASSHEERSIAVGDFKGSLSVYPLARMNDSVDGRYTEYTARRDAEKASWSVAKAHDAGINCIDGIGGLNVGYGASEIVTGSKDGVVRVWDTRIDTPVVSLVPQENREQLPRAVKPVYPPQAVPKEENPQEGNKGTRRRREIPSRDCWTVGFGGSFNNEERSVIAGYDNGDVKLFDLRMNKMSWETNLSNGVCFAEFDRKDIKPNKLVCTTLESRIVLFDLRVEQNTEKPENRFACLTKKAHKSTIWGCRHLPQNRDIFVSHGGNGGLNLYKYQYPATRKRTTLNGDTYGVMGELELLNSKIISTQPIVSFDWSKDKEGLCCLTAMDQTVRIFIVTKLNLY